MRNRLGIFLFITVLTTAVLGGWFGDRVSAGSPAEEDSASWLRTFTSALAAVEGNYVQTVPLGSWSRVPFAACFAHWIHIVPFLPEVITTGFRRNSGEDITV